jgi:hypothetical protein
MHELREMEEEAARLGSGISEGAAGKRQLMAGARPRAASYMWGRAAGQPALGA